MNYRSTRGGEPQSSTFAALHGLAKDGGLYIPENLPNIKLTYNELKNLSYQELSEKIIKLFFTEFTDEEIKKAVNSAYNSETFTDESIVPVYKLNDKVSFGELFHGRTLAFKDLALSLFPYLLLLSKEKQKEDKKILILAATSGDTGKAALEGFKDVDGINIVVFYPKNGVSPMQEEQMRKQLGNNVDIVAINGNFDDAQSAIKVIFGSEEFKKYANDHNVMFSSANSINIGRLFPQVIYYISTYVNLVNSGTIKENEEFNVVVPTGNFGNILAAYYAFKMGLPINNLIIASNKNNILTNFFETGEYNIDREFFKTISPSMDILISSNLERLLFELTGRNSEYIREIYKSLSEKGKFTVDKEVLKNSIFKADWADEDDTRETIKKSFTEEDYLFDTHTAVAKAVYDSHVKDFENIYTVIVSTASPFKFAIDVYNAISGKKEKDAVMSLSKLEDYTAWECPDNIANLKDKKIIHSKTINKEDARKTILAVMGINE